MCRSRLIQRSGIFTLLVAVGESLTEGGETQAASQKVVGLQNGQIKFGDEALLQ